MSARPRLRKIAYAVATVGLFFGGASLALDLSQRAGWIDDFRQDDTVLYVRGTYLKVDPADPSAYVVMDPQAPTVVQARFPIRKRANTLRVFITGESFVRGGHHIPPGVPPTNYGTIADWVRELLAVRYPSLDLQIINGGANGQNSFRIAQVVDEIVNVEPDLLVIAMGNNEGVAPPPVIGTELNQWILYRFLKKAALPELSRDERPAFQAPQLDASGMLKVFDANLDRMLAAAKAKAVPVELVTLPINLVDADRSMDAAIAQRAVAGDAACARADTLAAAGSCAEALEQGSACSDAFFLSVRAARCFAAKGDVDDQRAMLMAAVEVSPHGRTRPSFNESMRRRAAAGDAILADVERDMAERSAPGLSGSRDFIDRVHLTCMGYLPVARAIVAAAIDAGLVHGSWREPYADPTAAELLKTASWTLPKTIPGRPYDPVHAAQVCSPDPAAVP